MPALPTRATATVGALTCALALAACTAGGGAVGPTPTPTPTGPAAQDVVATALVPADGIEVEVGVHPLVRAGDLVVLTVDMVPQDPVQEEQPVHLASPYSVLSFVRDMPAPLSLRLFDLEGDVVHHGGTDAEGEPVVSERWDTITTSTGTRLQMAFAAPATDVDALAVLVPGAPLFADVPVVDDEVPPAVLEGQVPAEDGPTPTVAVPVALDLDRVVHAPTFPLESTSAELEGAVQTTESTESVEITLGADVLFAFDSAELTAEATAAIDLVAQRLAEREPGTVTVVGHTDDQGDDAYNQDLSQQRAQAVADALGGQVDAQDYPLDVEGRGETEPLVSGSSEEDRARNRRVVVTLVSTVVTRTEVTATGELPEFEGLVQEDPSALLRIDQTRSWDVRATARRVGGHVVVDLVVAAADDEVDSAWVAGFLRGWGDHRGDGTVSPHDNTARATVLDGAVRLYPMDYEVGVSETWPGGEWFTASDLHGAARIDGGQSRTYSYVYPRLDADAVTLQVGSGWSEGDFRIVDIPVEP